AAWTGLIGPWRRSRTDRQMARLLGERVPQLASDLLTSVELNQPEPPPPGAPSRRLAAAIAPSPELVGALASRTAERLAKVDPEQLVPRAPLWRPAQATLVAALIAAVVLWALPQQMASGYRALLSSGPGGRFGDAQASAVPLVGDLTLTLH